MPSRVPKIQIQIKLKYSATAFTVTMPLPQIQRCHHLYIGEAAAAPISARMPAHYTKLFFNPTAKMRCSLLRGCPGPHCDIFVAPAVIFYSFHCCDITVVLLPGCPRPLLPPNLAHYWDLAPPFPWVCPCIQCRDAHTVLGRMPSLTPWLCAIPYCRFAPLSSGKMSLQSMLGCPRTQCEDALALNARMPPANSPYVLQSYRAYCHVQCTTIGEWRCSDRKIKLGWRLAHWIHFLSIFRYLALTAFYAL
jgi:hypothetical protein